MLTLISRLLGGLRALVRRTREEEDLHAELHDFLDNAVEERVRAGMIRESAVRAARIEMGSLDALKDRVRDAGWESSVQSCWQDLRYAGRTLRTSPGFATVAILSLALGIGANTAIFSILNSLLFKPLPVAEPHRLAVIGSDQENSVAFTYPVWKALGDARLPGRSFVWATDRVTLTDTADLHFAETIWASGDAFSILGVPAALGRTFDARDDRRGGGPDGPVAVISSGFWQRRFGGAIDVVGRQLMIERVPFTVVGVTPPGFFGLNVGTSFDVMLPLEAEPLLGRTPHRLDSPYWPWLRVMVRLPPSQTLESLTSALSAAQPSIRQATMPPFEHAEDRDRYLRAAWVAKTASGGVSRLRREYGPALLTLLAIVGLVLLVVCASVATLTLARSAARRHEFAVRRALGGSRMRLIRQVLVESLMLSTVGALLGIAIAYWGSRLLVAQLSTWASTAVLDLASDWRVLLVTIGTTVITAVVFGFVPAYRSAHAPPIVALKRQGRSLASDGSGRLSGLLVVGQIALSLMLVVAAGLFLRSFTALAYRDLGFDRSRVLVAVVDARRTAVPPARRAALYDRVRAAVAAIPGVESAATSLATPLGSAGVRFTPDITMPGNAAFAGRAERVLAAPVSPGWFRTFGTRLLAGRDFDSHDRPGAPDVAIVNEAFARRYFNGAAPLGQTLVQVISPTKRRPLEIVGLVEDAAFTTVRDPVEPTIYQPLAQRLDERLVTAMPTISVSVRAVQGVSPGSLSGEVAAAVAGVDRDVTVFNQTVTEQLSHFYIRERLLASISAFFGILALLPAGIGLYGITAYSVSLRRKEIGIRMALGAGRGEVLRMIVGGVVWRAAAGIAAGAGASFWAARFVRALLYGLDAADPLTFAGAAAVLALVTAAAGWLPARRAARTDPAIVLRDE